MWLWAAPLMRQAKRYIVHPTGSVSCPGDVCQLQAYVWSIRIRYEISHVQQKFWQTSRRTWDYRVLKHINILSFNCKRGLLPETAHLLFFVRIKIGKYSPIVISGTSPGSFGNESSVQPPRLVGCKLALPHNPWECPTGSQSYQRSIPALGPEQKLCSNRQMDPSNISATRRRRPYSPLYFLFALSFSSIYHHCTVPISPLCWLWPSL